MRKYLSLNVFALHGTRDRKIKSLQIDLDTKTANIYSRKNFSFYSMKTTDKIVDETTHFSISAPGGHNYKNNKYEGPQSSCSRDIA